MKVGALGLKTKELAFGLNLKPLGTGASGVGLCSSGWLGGSSSLSDEESSIGAESFFTQRHTIIMTDTILSDCTDTGTYM